MRMIIERTRRQRLPLRDAVICVASLQAGATHLLSEDMQDGAGLDGLLPPLPQVDDPS